MKECIRTHVASDNQTYYKDADTSMQDVVNRLHDIASKARTSYLKKEGKLQFTEQVDVFWARYLTRILSSKKTSDDEEMFDNASVIFKLPANNIDKYFVQRKHKYFLNKGFKYELSLEQCTTCRKKTKIIGGSCTLDSHATLASALKEKRKRDKKHKEAAKNKAVKVTCKCGCWSVLRPDEHAPKFEDKDDNGKVIKTVPCTVAPCQQS